MKTKYFLLLLSTVVITIAFTSCNQTKLSNEEAKELIITSLNLPVTFGHNIDKIPSMSSGFQLDGLRKAGLINGSEYLDSRRLIEIQITELGKSSFLGENNNTYMFKTNNIDFNQITGISINKEEQTATVRFTVKATNVTLAAYALANTNAGFSGKKYINYSLIKPLIGELIFKKFDSGWQLQFEQGKASAELLNQLLDSDVNSNKLDDYSKLINDKRTEIYENEFDEKEKEFNLAKKNSKDGVPTDTKIITLASPSYFLGDSPHLSFIDIATHKQEEYEYNWDLPAIQEIMTKCENQEGCPALRGQFYSAILKSELLDALEYNVETGAQEPTGEKERKWIVVALKKIHKH
jgi:hypothetical protein